MSPSSKCVFERRLIEKYIAEKGTDPISGEELSVDQLIEIKNPPVMKPRPPSATSIPAILKILQDEWDACMMNSFAVRQELLTTRLELSRSLYQHDAACRVIARLQKEVTASREALATLKPHAAVSQPREAPYGLEADESAEATDEEIGMSEALQEKASALTAVRKQRGKAIPENLIKPEVLSGYVELASHMGLHSASMPGITCMDVHLTNPNYIVTGGNDKNVVVFNKETEEIVAILKGHQKRVLKVAYHPTEEDMVISSGADSIINVWSVGAQKSRHIIRAHTTPVTGISIHATGDYILSVSSGEKWAFSDIRSGRLLFRVDDSAPSSQGMTCAQFHPDGLIFGIGNVDTTIKIWDLKERTNVANFPGHAGAIRALSFSENGYYLASVGDDSAVKIWDLRKLKNLKTINLSGKFQARDVCFDLSGNYLAVSGADVRVFQSKSWNELVVLKDHTDLATGVRFGENACFIVTCGMDRALRIFGQSEVA
ncbi:WD40 and Prp19 domain containing protein [Trichuris trichiura]|uniref:Pre-mRNA-processing factor 19 n=1 Tax=Trichuris trichiura TaxID=36087 RepID=A0A077ZB22_TRITR|nr:WD40 and Prp19 domain containing protein [Trichuris trichiura]